MSRQSVHLNPKLFISQYFDSIINQIDIHTEEQLESFSKRDKINNSFDYQYKSPADHRQSEDDFYDNHNEQNDEQITYGIESYTDSNSVWYNYDHQPWREIPLCSMRIRDYLNATRAELIAEVELVQAEIFKRYDEIKNSLLQCHDQDSQIEELKRAVFANKFVGIFRIDKVYAKEMFTVWQENKHISNPVPFKLYLVIFDFYMDLDQQNLLRTLIGNHLTGSMFFGEKQEKFGKGIKLENKSIKTFNKMTLRAEMLKNYIYGLVDHQKFVHVMKIKQTDLFRVDKIQLGDMKLNFNEIHLNLEDEKDEFSHIKSLVIKSNPLNISSKVRINNLECLTNLTCLEVNKIHLTDMSLQNLTHLKRLELVECDFKFFKSQSFQYVPNLEILLIKEPRNYAHVKFENLAKLRWLHVDNFSNFDFLESLNEFLEVLEVTRSIDDSNSLEFFQLLSSLSNLRVLDLTGNKLEYLNAQMLSSLTNLRYLKCHRIKQIDLKHDFLSRLELLDLKSSFLQGSLDFAFSKLANLKLLDLNNSKGIQLNPLSQSNLFAGLSQLNELRLAYVNPRSGSRRISADLFQGLTQLTVLSLYGNYLTEIDARTFSHTPNLQRLDIGSNSLNVRKEMFEYLGRLRLLDLTSNDIEKLEDGVFVYLENLETLSLRGNPIKLKRATFDGLGKLAKLDLHLTEANHIDVGLFVNLPCLKQVRIDEYFRKKQPELMDMDNDKFSFIFRS